ncbi:MAG: glycosyltransferase family 4 protein [Immundisolibacter sp.]|uniref:glycosyltransferase family 4 protein n=1 Tax=Immundisolibacter sp. TaxID=1934948 RepID=UPI003EE14FDB
MTEVTGSPLRVLHLCPDPKHLTDLFGLYRDALDQPPFASTVVFLRGGPDMELASRFDGRVHFLLLPQRTLEGLRLRALWRLWRLCRSSRFDLIVAHRFKALTLALALCRLGVAREAFGIVHEIGQFEGRRRRVIERARASALTLLGVSEAVRDDLQARLPRFPAARIKALPNAVSDHFLLPRAEACAALGLSVDRFWFACIGRLVTVKGHDVLLRAFAPLARERPLAALALVGAGPEEDALRALADELGISERVVFCGWHTGVRKLLAAFDVCVFPSREEAFGLAIAEAMVARRPVIASAVGGVPALLGAEGLLVPQGNTPALTAALRQLRDDASLRQAMGASLRARWEAEFSPSQFAGQLRALARQALETMP